MMQKKRAFQLKNYRQNEKGQTVIEYLLSLFVVLTAATLFTVSLKSGLFRLWGYYFYQVSAPCPGCKVPDPVKQVFH